MILIQINHYCEERDFKLIGVKIVRQEVRDYLTEYFKFHDKIVIDDVYNLVSDDKITIKRDDFSIFYIDVNTFSTFYEHKRNEIGYTKLIDEAIEVSSKISDMNWE